MKTGTVLHWMKEVFVLVIHLQTLKCTLTLRYIASSALNNKLREILLEPGVYCWDCVNCQNIPATGNSAVGMSGNRSVCLQP